MVLTKMIMAIKLGGQHSTTFSDLTFPNENSTVREARLVAWIREGVSQVWKVTPAQSIPSQGPRWRVLSLHLSSNSL